MTLVSSRFVPCVDITDFKTSLMKACVSLASRPVAETANTIFVAGSRRVPSKTQHNTVSSITEKRTKNRQTLRTGYRWTFVSPVSGYRSRNDKRMIRALKE